MTSTASFFSNPDEFEKPLLYCDLNLGGDTKLKKLNKGEEIVVSGTVKCFQSQQIELDLDRIAYGSLDSPK